MPNSDGKQAENNEPLTNLLQNAQKKFGELLREVCQVAGFTQGKLSQEAKEELERLIEIGDVRPNDVIGSMEQPTISKVMAGSQGPTYYQVYIWLNVLRKHYESSQFAEICENLNISLPTLSSKLEQELWRLSTFVPPDELRQVYEEAKNVKLIQIYKSLMEDKEMQQNDVERNAASKRTNERRKSSSKAVKAHKVAMLND